LRPAKDYLIGSLEFMVPTMAIFPRTYNWLMDRKWANKLSSKYLGLTDNPKLSKYNLKKEMSLRGIRLATPLAIESLSYKDRSRAVIVVQDAFTSYFETQLVLDTMELLSRLGFQAYLAPYMPNGKPLHVHGFMRAFNKTARKNLDMLQSLSFYGLPFIGIDPSMTLTYRSEYTKAFGHHRQIPKIQLMQEWLAEKKDHLIKQPLMCEESTYHLMTHCTEKTNAAGSIKDWQQVYSLLGLELKVENVGCCGMAGTYGHETANKDTSKTIYELSWKEKVNAPELSNKLVATGYSCRSQAKRFDDVNLPHPIQVLLKHVREVVIK
ncbi:MAG: (Fe-S)-binding protein, partial [Marinomonas sp.]